MGLWFCDFRCSCHISIPCKQTNISSEEEQEAAGGFLQEKDSDQHSQEYISCDDWWQPTDKNVKSNDLFSDYFQVQTFRSTNLSSKQACYFPATNI